jgi:hypothetical protein
MLIEKYNHPFEKTTPSLFVVGTPFQALCAIEVIKDLEIEKYSFYVVKDGNRDDQMISLVDKFNIKYDIVDRDKDIYPYLKRLICLKSNICGFKRGFVGSHDSTTLFFFALRLMDDNSTVISLDDGNKTISILKESVSRKPLNILSFINLATINLAARRRNIVLRKHLYTIYSDIPNSRYLCCSNTFSHVIPNHMHVNKGGVYFVGTYATAFVKMIAKISLERYYQLLAQLFSDICTQYPNETKTYIPHGRDRDEKTQGICENYGFSYERPENIIEMHLIQQISYPSLIIGFSSSALFNLKKIFPEAKVVDILVDNEGHIDQRHFVVSEYYVNNGIDRVIIKL